MPPAGCPGSSRTMTSPVRKTARFRRWPARCGRTALAAVGLVQPHSRDLSTSTSQPGEDGSKPCSTSQRTASRLRNDHHARITVEVDVGAVAGDDVAKVLLVSERQAGEIDLWVRWSATAGYRTMTGNASSP